MDSMSKVESQMNPSNGVDRKSTRLNSSHLVISYAVFCLKKKKANKQFTVRARSTATHQASLPPLRIINDLTLYTRMRCRVHARGVYVGHESSTRPCVSYL